MEIKIDPEFKSMIPPLTKDEFEQLERNIIADGCREPLTVWGDILIDGHNRYEICEKHGKSFQTFAMDFDDRLQVELWMRYNQIGRRNMTPDQMSIMRGTIYNIEKKAPVFEKENPGGPGRGNKTGDHNDPPLKTAEKVAERTGVSPATIKRDAKFVDSINHIKKTVDPDIEKKIIAKQAPPRKDIIKAAEFVEKHPKRANDILTGKKKAAQVIKQIKKEEVQKKKEEVNEFANKVGSLEVIPKISAELGQWWELGNHLLFCGDTSSEEFKAKLTHAEFVFADPPYNADAATWDNSFEWDHDYLIRSAKIVMVTPGIESIQTFFKKTEMPYKWSMSCWITNGMTRGAIGFGNWIYAAIFSKGSIYRNGQDHVRVTIKNNETVDTSHKGRKPATFISQIMELFTKENDTVIDPFLGSGTTLYVSEQLSRKCIGGEINPEFCTDIINRWEKLTGEKAKCQHHTA